MYYLKRTRPWVFHYKPSTQIFHLACTIDVAGQKNKCSLQCTSLKNVLSVFNIKQNCFYNLPNLPPYLLNHLVDYLSQEMLFYVNVIKCHGDAGRGDNKSKAFSLQFQVEINGLVWKLSLHGFLHIHARVYVTYILRVPWRLVTSKQTGAYVELHVIVRHINNNIYSYKALSSMSSSVALYNSYIKSYKLKAILR